MEDLLNRFTARIAEAAASNAPLRIRGGGTKDWYGQALQGDILDTREYAGIVSYEPTELVLTARAGTRLREIEAVLAEHKQMLAFEPPQFGPDSTMAGVMAAGLSGPRRQAAGAVRDFVLGAVLMDGKGDIHHFGGQVMKNVAGYDVSRLLAGSLGTLGLILEVSLKVLPQPLRETTLRFEMNEAEALERLNQWGGQPLPISASAWHGGVLIVRLSGADAAIRSAMQKLGGEEDAHAADFWRELRDHDNSYFAVDEDAAALWRLSVPSTAPPLALAGEQLIEWGGAQRWLRTTLDARAIREAVGKLGGHATLFRGGDKSAGVFHPLAAPVARIHRDLKHAFDPAGIFNPGRMYPEL